MKSRAPILPALGLAAAMLSLSPVAAMAKTWQVDPAHSTLGFSDSYQGETFHGVFKKFNAAIDYDPAHVQQSHFDVTVDLSSVDTQSPERDQTLTGEDFFNIGAHPKAHFVSNSFHQDAAGQVTAQGTLTLNGISHAVTLAVDFKPAASGATLAVKTTLNRLDYRLGHGSDWDGIGKQVPVQASLSLK